MPVVSEDYDEKKAHRKLLRSVSGRLKSRKHYKTETGSGGASRVFVGDGTVEAGDLSRSGLVDSRNKLVRKFVRKPALNKLNLSERSKLEREAAYGVAKETLGFWDAFVETQKAAPSLSFPLEKPQDLDRGQSLLTFPNPKFQKSTNVAKLIEVAAAASKSVVKVDEGEFVKTNKGDDGLMIMAAEYKKLRQRAEDLKRKNRRIKKIKSRNFHRLQRKLDAKKAAKAGNVVVKAISVNDRIEERMTLKHNKVSRKLRKIVRHAKYDPNARQILHEHRQLGLEKRNAVEEVVDGSGVEEETKIVEKVENDSDSESKSSVIVDDSGLNLEMDPVLVNQMLNYWNVRPEELSLEDVLAEGKRKDEISTDKPEIDVGLKEEIVELNKEEEVKLDEEIGNNEEKIEERLENKLCEEDCMKKGKKMPKSILLKSSETAIEEGGMLKKAKKSKKKKSKKLPKVDENMNQEKVVKRVDENSTEKQEIDVGMKEEIVELNKEEDVKLDEEIDNFEEKIEEQMENKLCEKDCTKKGKKKKVLKSKLLKSSKTPIEEGGILKKAKKSGKKKSKKSAEVDENTNQEKVVIIKEEKALKRKKSESDSKEDKTISRKRPNVNFLDFQPVKPKTHDMIAEKNVEDKIESNADLKKNEKPNDDNSIDIWDNTFTLPSPKANTSLSQNLADFEADFKERKRKILESELKPELEDAGMCGLQSNWIGPGLTNKKSKPKPFDRRKLREIKQRRDAQQPHVIINQSTLNESVKKFQVKTVPFPFKTVADYEETLKQPLGKLWVPEVAFKRLNVPKIRTLLGTPIEPPQKNRARPE